MTCSSCTFVVVLCALSVLLSQVTARPSYSASADSASQIIGAKERQELIKYAAKLLQILMRPTGDSDYLPQKRNSGTLDAVMHMPDLYNIGK